ncbi:DUF3221 domain-containing protein [Anaerocolumna sp.]|uniref:DUF3221 domain-containing protein n=1 Tax=Anaerocolumna sp. TaxID=2041569 RepID=UPI0028A92D10|nr:DUF3221 domain-containing protein [Anaerocolumna sp.]
MNRRMFFYLFILLISGILAGCTNKNFTIEGVKLKYTNIEVRDGTAGTMVSLDKEQSEGLYNYIKKIEFKKDRTSEKSTGWRYALDFMADGKVIDTIMLRDESTISYRDNFYKTDVSMDLDYIASLCKYVFNAVVIDNDNGLLVRPDVDSNEFKSSDKISVGTNNTIIYDENKKKVDLDEVQIGDSIKITYNGIIMESYPAQIAAEYINILESNLLISGYITIIDEIYKEDSGLNNDIGMIALNLTEIENLSEEDKEILLMKLYNTYGLEVKESTYEQLLKEGLITEKGFYFPSGILITISNSEYNESKKTLNYDIKKWRSGLGAVGYKGKAEFNGEKWIISKENMWMS